VKRLLFFVSRKLPLLVLFPANVSADPVRGELDPLILMGRGDWGMWGERQVRLHDQRYRATDGASLLDRSPGVAIVRNGSQTGIVQMRGLTGDRVKVLLDDMSISPACPNHMDPPMHYVSASSDSEFALTLGVTPVRYGGDSLSGTVRMSRPKPLFAEAGPIQWSGELSANYQGSHHSYASGVELGMASDKAIFEYRGGWSTADDLRYPGGTVKGTGYKNQHQDIYTTLRTGNGYLVFDAGLTRTRDAGTPVLPMDMIEADSWHAGIRHVANLENARLESRIYIHSIDHIMDNYSLRRAPKMKMEAPSTSRDYGLRSVLELPCDESVFRMGIDLHRNEFDATQVLVASGKERDMFADNRRSRSGAFVEFEKDWSDQWSGLFGLRGDYVTSRAASVSSQFGPPPVAADAAEFNAGKRSHNDLLVDVAATVAFTPDEVNRYEVSMGVKNRAPSLLERYLWTPLNASAGMADGRTYLGNTDLDPETAFQLTASASHRAGKWLVQVSPFYNRIHHYIQGSPIARNDAAGMPVLQFQNFDWVDLYGAELAASYQYTDHIEISAQLSYVRGKNQDTNDDLYRISPLHGLVDLGWEDGSWEAHVELDWAAAQNDVSDFNGESSSPGYALVHLRGAYQIKEGTRIEVGVENIFDEEYAAHLSGVNRVTGSDVAVGESIPGAGRFFYTSLRWSF